MTRIEQLIARDAGIVARTIEAIDDRAMSADGPVTPTLREATVKELRRIYQAAKRIQRWHIHARTQSEGNR